MSNKLTMLVETELSKLSEKEKEILKDKLKKEKYTSESIRSIIGEELKSLTEASVDKVKNDLLKVIDNLKKNFTLYKKAKDSGNEKDTEKYKKIALSLTSAKRKLEKDLDNAIGGLYADAELQLEGRGKKVSKNMWKKMTDDEKYDALLTVVKDPDDAEKHIESKWSDLPSGFERDMYTEGKLTEKLARGLKPLLKLGSAITKKVGEDKLLKLSDAFEKLDDERGDDIAGDLNMAIEKMQDGYPREATGWLKRFNKECKKALKEGKVKNEGQLNEITAKETLTNAVSALTKTIGGRKLDKGYIKDYLKSMEKMARKNPGTFVKDYGEFDVSDWLEDVRYNLQNEGKLNESMIGIKTKANFKPLQLKGALERAGIKGFQMNRLSVTLTALKLDKKYFNDAKKIVDDLGLAVMMAKESVNEEDYKYKKYASKAFKEINDAMFNFRHSMGIKTLTNKDMKLKKKVESLHQAIFSLQKEMKKDGLTEASSLWKHFDAKMKLQDTIMDLEYDMKMINKDLSQLHRDMEQEAEPAGGKIADRYGREIDKKEKEYKKKKAEFKKLMAKLDRMEQF